MEAENFKKHEGKNRLKELAEDIKICMMITGLHKNELNAVPMTTKKVDDEGNIWFLSLKNSLHNRQIHNDPKVQLLYSDPVKMEFLNISGNAEISQDRAFLEDLFDEETDNWFEEIENEKLTAIKFIPGKAHYWDTQTNKYEALYHLGIATLTGEEKHSGDKGKLSL